MLHPLPLGWLPSQELSSCSRNVMTVMSHCNLNQSSGDREKGHVLIFSHLYIEHIHTYHLTTALPWYRQVQEVF